MNKVYSFLAFAFIVIVGAITGGVGDEVAKNLAYTDEDKANNIEKKISEGFQKAAERINEKCPFMVDEETRMDKAIAGPEAQLTFHHTFINYSSGEISEPLLLSEFRELVIKKVCNNQEMKALFQYGAKYIYSYNGNDGVRIGSFPITYKDCGYMDSDYITEEKKEKKLMGAIPILLMIGALVLPSTVLCFFLMYFIIIKTVMKSYFTGKKIFLSFLMGWFFASIPGYLYGYDVYNDVYLFVWPLIGALVSLFIFFNAPQKTKSNYPSNAEEIQNAERFENIVKQTPYVNRFGYRKKGHYEIIFNPSIGLLDDPENQAFFNLLAHAWIIIFGHDYGELHVGITNRPGVRIEINAHMLYIGHKYSDHEELLADMLHSVGINRNILVW